MSSLSDGFKDVFLAGVGAMALTGEKAKGLIDTLIDKGEITVEQGKELNSELTQKASETVKKIRYETLEKAMGAMTPEQREEFVQKAVEFAEKAKGQAAEAGVADVAEAEIVVEATVEDAAPDEKAE
ncbi:hypothetical protein [Xiamenia xianingshaonis]|uniref:Polyhydroxyalkanoate synthesis regulator phasin n=1 Tax=Xiamenia xianingshaonis TaxID=2682776 RepID=A0A9E6MQH7_9ACTN|nr:hypothetical protein [Xiamenia xianingshaonis]NGM16881.1 hypothetical protein [Eggerthellaceae bacterium zg-893]NHM14225.1 hypothetical protein [Xiamenia xianingshaonis]NHM15694.1 hypothetical protein [Xiamenia xianingshaonis]QTU84163.1 hypothetical protein J7S26_07375 [Xiamenia xianingshaonis]